MSEPRPCGIIGVFDTPQAMLETARLLRGSGFRRLDAYTPYPVEGLDELAGAGRSARLPALIFGGAVIGAAAGYFIQYWDEALSYPINVGGRPYDSWPAFTVGAVEFMLLFAVAAGFFGLWRLCGLPRLYDPIFAAAGFERVSQDRFVLCVEADDPRFEPETVRRLLTDHGAESVAEVPA